MSRRRARSARRSPSVVEQGFSPAHTGYFMKQRLLTAAVVVLAALPLHAAEEAPAALSPFSGNVGNAVWTLGIFLIVVVLLGKFAWGPILSLLQQREQFIHNSLSEAKRDRDEAERMLKEYNAKVQS